MQLTTRRKKHPSDAIISSPAHSSACALALLTAIFALNFLDRQIVTILAVPMRWSRLFGQFGG
jgi:hypothetical protein